MTDPMMKPAGDQGGWFVRDGWFGDDRFVVRAGLPALEPVSPMPPPDLAFHVKRRAAKADPREPLSVVRVGEPVVRARTGEVMIEGYVMFNSGDGIAKHYFDFVAGRYPEAIWAVCRRDLGCLVAFTKDAKREWMPVAMAAVTCAEMPGVSANGSAGTLGGEDAMNPARKDPATSRSRNRYRKLTVEVAPRLKERLDAAARHAGQSITEIVIAAIAAELERRGE